MQGYFIICSEKNDEILVSSALFHLANRFVGKLDCKTVRKLVIMLLVIMLLYSEKIIVTQIVL